DWTKLKGVPAGFADGTDAGASRPQFARGALDSSGSVGGNVSVTIGVDGLGLIAYSDESNQDLKVAHCANVECTTATLTTLDSAGSVGNQLALVVGSDGLGIIVYVDATNQDLKVAHCGNGECTSATLSVLDGAIGPDGGYPSVAVGTDGFAYVSYFEGTNDDLKFARCTALDCSTSAATVLDSAGTTGQYTSITIGSRLGHPVIAYYKSVTGLRVLECASLNCSTTTTIDSPDSSGGKFASLAALPTGGYVVSSYDAGSKELHTAYCPPPTSGTRECTGTYVVTTVDASVTDIGVGTSASVVEGLPVISYGDVTGGDLRVARCWVVNCSAASTITLDSAGSVGDNSSLTIGPDGFPLVAYHDATNGDLRVAHCANVACVPYFRAR
ncbi:MAG: hypothetical protein LC624_03120, partial [Halobacteriales archaeon]|nr:hypothetical protein [Halobacteriales archaeon]